MSDKDVKKRSSMRKAPRALGDVTVVNPTSNRNTAVADGRSENRVKLKFHRIGEKHSIQEFVLSIRFARPIGDRRLLEANQRAQELAKDANLPGRMDQPGFSFSFGPPGVMQPPQHTTATSFRRFAPDGTVQEELNVDREGITYRTVAYERWAGIVDKLERIVLPVAAVYLTEALHVSSLLIQYVDRFLYDDNSDVNWGEIFTSNCPWIVQALRDETGPWHSHCGRFEQSTDPEFRRLINVNIDVAEFRKSSGASPQRSMGILTVVGDQASANASVASILDQSGFASTMRGRFDVMHSRSKDLLRELLSDSYREAIGLD